MKINGIQVERPNFSIENFNSSSKKDGFSIEKETPSKTDGFSNAISEAINNVNNTQVQANQAVENMLTGENKNIHETMVSLEKADISMKLMIGIRNKALDAYNTISKMR